MTTSNKRARPIGISTQKDVHYIRRKPVPYDDGSLSSASSSKTVVLDDKPRGSGRLSASAASMSAASFSMSQPDSEPFRQLLSYRILMSKEAPVPDSDEGTSMGSPRRQSHTSSSDPKTRSPSLSISSVESVEELYDQAASTCTKRNTFAFSGGLHRGRAVKHRQTLHSFDPSSDCSPLSTVADLPMVSDCYSNRPISDPCSPFALPKGYWNRPLMEDSDRFDGFTPPIFAEEVNWGTAL